jgi:hypothetical protein
MVAVGAVIDMSAQGGGTAHFNGPHNAMLLSGQTVPLPVWLAKATEDVGHLDRGPRQSRSPLIPLQLGSLAAAPASFSEGHRSANGQPD